MNKKDNSVNQVFSSIATVYDIMNNVISFGTHIHFKKTTIKKMNIISGERILDLAAGTGDLTKMIQSQSTADIVQLDANREMLHVSKNRIRECKQVLSWAEKLPFRDESFDKVIIGFGIRNFESNDLVFKEINRILKSVGKLVILEFGQPRMKIFRFFRDFYLKNIVPIISKILINKYAEYKYLASSVAAFPEQNVISNMLTDSGFTCKYNDYLFGAITIYECIK